MCLCARVNKKRSNTQIKKSFTKKNCNLSSCILEANTQASGQRNKKKVVKNHFSSEKFIRNAKMQKIIKIVTLAWAKKGHERTFEAWLLISGNINL